jgi:hypothetical protein
MISSETLAAAARVEAHAARRIMTGLADLPPAPGYGESRPVETAATPLRQAGMASNELQFLPHVTGNAAFAIRPASPVDASSDRHLNAKNGNDSLRIQSSNSL